MNPKPISETEALRSDIEMTRRRMDDTMNALGQRMQGRHILDEVIGFFRSNSEKTTETSTRVREKLSQTAGKISDSAGTAANAIVDTVKNNPLPILLITAGAAWLAYNATRNRRSDFEEEDFDESERYDPDTHYDRPLSYPGGTSSEMGGGESTTGEGMMGEAGSKFGEMKESVHEKASEMKQKMSEFGERAREKFGSVKERASEFGSRVKDRASQIGERVQDRTREVYGKTRESVASTANQHPLELGLGCLAVGVLVGLSVPTPGPVNRFAGPTVDRLKNRTRDAGREMMQKGKRVVQAASSAAKQEAESQGLTAERLRESGSAIGARAEDAASRALENDEPDVSTQNQNRTAAERADPSAARPAM